VSAAFDYDRETPEPAPASEPAPESAPEHPLRWTATVMAVAGLFLLVFNARALSSWMADNDKAPTPATLEARAIAEGWTAATSAVWLDRPHAAIHAVWERRKTAGADAAQR
jgi:hypothetical protein